MRFPSSGNIRFIALNCLFNSNLISIFATHSEQLTTPLPPPSMSAISLYFGEVQRKQKSLVHFQVENSKQIKFFAAFTAQEKQTDDNEKGGRQIKYQVNDKTKNRKLPSPVHSSNIKLYQKLKLTGRRGESLGKCRISLHERH